LFAWRRWTIKDAARNSRGNGVGFAAVGAHKPAPEDEGSRNPMSVEQLQQRMRGWLNQAWRIDLLLNKEARGMWQASPRWSSRARARNGGER